MLTNMSRLCNFGAFICAGVVLALSIGGFFPQLHWTLSWYSHPRPQFVLIGVILGGWFLIQHKWELAILPLLIVLINGTVLAPFYMNVSDHPSGQADLTFLHLNTDKGAADMSPLANYPADILFLQEVTPELEANFAHIFPDYRVALSHPLTNTQGIAMLTHVDFEIDTELHTIHHMPWYNYRPLLTTHLTLNEKRLQIMSLHTGRPHHEGADAFQQLELDAAAAWSREQQAFGYEIVMIGDLNVTPWSVRYKDFLQDSQTQDSMVGYGIQNSWTAVVPMWLGLPIDHAAVSEGLIVLDRETIQVDGSDHGALFVRVSTAE